MKVLFATTNPAKIKFYAEALKNAGLEVLTLKDLDINMKVEENGKTALENAYLKAKGYYDIAHIPTIGIDDNLYIEGIPDNLQPGTHVRRVNGRELNDDEMLEYYQKLVDDHGNKLVAKWVYGLVIYDGTNKYEYSWSKNDFYLVANPSAKRHPGYPLDSISIDPLTNKYFTELTEEDKKNCNNIYYENDIIKFILGHL
ncbi:MAG: non-canonical purine NTP pyrophosphatase [Bacilli bacterium]|nr:non-canonical purine NTP pyrophosphatase [Bacilli bacterium]